MLKIRTIRFVLMTVCTLCAMIGYTQTAALTNLVLAEADGRVTITPVVSPNPAEATEICYELYEDNTLTSRLDTFSFHPTGTNNNVWFWEPSLPGTYYIRALFKTGNTCGGTLLNELSRVYFVPYDLLLTSADSKLYDNLSGSPSLSPLSEKTLTYKGDGVYETDIFVQPGAQYKLLARYGEEPTELYFKGSESTTEQLIGGTGSTLQPIRIVYDLRTNSLIAAWLPAGTVSEATPIETDIMLIRSHQEAGQNILLSNGGSLTDVQTAYGVLQLSKSTIEDETLPEYERFNYFISFPFDVRVGDIFGCGTYGTHWVLKYYDGASRAANGFWADSPSNWKYITDTDSLLHAYQGYLLKLSISRMADIWANGATQVELCFPSTGALGTIGIESTVTLPALGDKYRCTINRGDGTDGDRRIKDSYWRCIGVPSFADYSDPLEDQSSATINWQPDGNTLPFLYEWRTDDNRLLPVSGSSYDFSAMHAYLVQNGGQITWSNVAAVTNPIVARRTYRAHENDLEWCLKLRQENRLLDQTFIRLSDDELVTDAFDFNQDLVKEINPDAPNIYSFIGSEKVAANSLPFSAKRSIPLGLQIESAGDYTFALSPNPQSPISDFQSSITLLDTETGTRTPFSTHPSHTVSLTPGTYDSRFILELSSDSDSPTALEPLTDNPSSITATKMIIGNHLYILRSGHIYTPTGQLLK